MTTTEALETLIAAHEVVWDKSFTYMDIDPFTRCACGESLPCRVRLALVSALEAVNE